MARPRLIDRCGDPLTDFDVLLCPITPTTSTSHDHQPDVDARRLNVNDRPRPPRGGLPDGLQVIGPYLEDRTVIDVAGHIGELPSGFVLPPGS